MLYLGIYITIFLFSCGLVGYGIENHMIYPEPKGFELVIPILDLKVGVIWILGIFGMIAGLLGIVDVIEASFVPILFRRKHSM